MTAVDDPLVDGSDDSPPPDTEGVDRPDPDRPAPERFATGWPERVVDVVVAFLCIGTVTAWTFDPFRRQFTSGTFANYFEHQARSFLDGHLAVEQGLLGIEAFIRDGREYMYFGPLLSIFRIPVVFVSDQLDGRMTAISLLIGTLVFYVQAIKLLDNVLTIVHPSDAPTSGERGVRLAWRASVATGTVVLTLLAIPWSYHEAHLWSAAMFVFLLNQILRFPTSGWQRTWVFGLVLLGVVLNRPTTAYAGLIGAGTLLLILIVRSDVPRAAMVKLGAWTVGALATTVTINYAKFRLPFGIPMEDQFFTKVDENRAEMLRIYDNKYFQLEFIPSNLWAYFKPNGVDLSTTFPYVGTPRAVPWVWGDAFYDATYRTASVTATSPLLFVASIVGVIVFVSLVRRPSFWTLTPSVVAGVVAAGGVAGWGYMSTRYLTDFLPGMLVLSAIGCAGVLRWLARREQPLGAAWVRAIQVTTVGLVVWSILANLAIAYTYSFSVGDRQADVPRYLGVQDAMSNLVGPSLADRVVFVDTLPYDRQHPPAPGTLAIVGDCEALYYSNGEPVDSWVAIEYGESDWRRDWTVAPSPTLEPGSEVELVRLTASPDVSDIEGYWFTLSLIADEVRPDDDLVEFTLAMRDNYGEIRAEMLDMPLERSSELSVTFDKHRRLFFVELDGANKLFGHFDMDPLYDTPETGIRFLPPGTYGGFEFEELASPTPLCDRLADAARS